MNQILSVLDCASYPARLMADEFKFRISMSALLVAIDGCVGAMNIPLSYDPETGLFTWLKRPRMTRTAKEGDRAGSISSSGYVVITICGVKYMAHRLAWFVTYGAWPAEQIDHINGVRNDNRIANLRDVSHTVNVQNRRTGGRNSKTGLLGVSPSKKGYAATISANGKQKFLGRFKTPEEASAVYIEAKRRLHLGYVAQGAAGTFPKNA